MKGLFFGSFDPPHIGHVNVVTSVLNSGLVDKIEVIPAFQNPWKENSTPFSIRYEMCRYTFSIINNVYVNPIELVLSIDTKNPIHTYQVIDKFRGRYRPFKIIMTEETFNDLYKWKEGERIIKENKFIIVVNSNNIFGVAIDEFNHYDNIEFVSCNFIDIHSTNIRERIKNELVTFPFINKDVINIINNNKLYKE